MKLAFLLLISVLCSAQCTPDANGICNTGLTAVQNNLLGPLIPYGASPWIFGDLAEKGVADNMAPKAIAEVPVLGTQLSGTVSWTQATNSITTTSDNTALLAGQQWIALAWNSIDGAGTGRALCPISSVTSTTITCQANIFAPTSSGINAYVMSVVPDANGITFLGWTAGSPTVSWNYYDVAIGLYRLYYRTLNTTYQTEARAYADIQWQWVLDHGYNYPTPRAESMVSQYFRALDGHPERLPGLYLIAQKAIQSFGQFLQFCPFCDAREDGYALWDPALGAKVDTDPTRHASYCSMLTTYSAWPSILQSDGSLGENGYASNAGYVDAVKSYTGPPFIYQGSPWRSAIDVKSMEAGYESLKDTSSQGCNNPTMAAAILTAITNLVTWQVNYGRDSVDRGNYYEANSQSQDQNSVHGTGTASVSLTSTAVTGVGTNWKTSNACTNTPYVGFQIPNSPRQVYHIASCADDTHMVLSNAMGLFGETMNVVNSAIDFAPAATGGCHSSATFCFGTAGDRNLTRTNCGAYGWLYAQTLNSTYKSWADECASATLGGPTAGLTVAVNVDTITLPCSGPACDGFVNDMVASVANCMGVPQTFPCANGVIGPYANLGKNFGEAWGAPGIDNELAWRLTSVGPGPCSISPATLGPWTNTQAISQTMSTTCSGGTITWTSSGLPTGLSGCNGVTGSSCTISGTLSAASLYSPTITATASNVASISPAVLVNPVPSISTTSLANATAGMAYSQTLSVSGGTSPLTCSISSGTLAGSGLALGASSCAVTGTPTSTVATYSFIARVTDANGVSATQPLTVSVAGSPCDLNSDGIINVQDTQLAVNMSLSIIPCTANINGAGVCNSVTISRVVTASLGGACVVGP